MAKLDPTKIPAATSLGKWARTATRLTQMTAARDSEEHGQRVHPPLHHQRDRDDDRRNGRRMARGEAHIRRIEREHVEGQHAVGREKLRARPPENPLDEVGDEPRPGHRDEKEAGERRDLRRRRRHFSFAPRPVSGKEQDDEKARGDERPLRLAEARDGLEEELPALGQVFGPGDRRSVERQSEDRDEHRRDETVDEKAAPRPSACGRGHPSPAKPCPEQRQIAAGATARPLPCRPGIAGPASWSLGVVHPGGTAREKPPASPGQGKGERWFKGPPGSDRCKKVDATLGDLPITGKLHWQTPPIAVASDNWPRIRPARFGVFTQARK